MFSPFRVRQGDGLGHGLATVNMEVVAAIRLGLTYTHRRPKFGALSDEDPDAIEIFFGWERNELSAKAFYETNCIPTPHPRGCRICGGLSKRSKMTSVVQLPSDIITGARADDALLHFLAMNNQSHTVFTIESSICSTSPAYSEFSLSRPWFFWKYWDSRAQMQGLVDPSSPNETTVQDFNDKEISIAVHVRRGDFFDQKKRKLLNCSTYAQIIRTVQGIIEDGGNRFSRMPVAVYIYSEGRPKDGYDFGTHDVRRLSEDFLDENKVVRGAEWWTDLLVRTPPQNDRTSDRRRQPAIPRVELRISKPTLSTTHQMIAADVFIGSLSGLSTNLVRALSRGVQIHPGSALPVNYCCSVSADAKNGMFEREAFAALWSDYALAHGRFVT
jgi:hypothetical protein